MKINNNHNILSYHSEGNETESELAFLSRMKQYIMKAVGFTVLIQDHHNRLISYSRPCDNTQFICADDGYSLAADFGAKRFLVSDARKKITKEKAEQLNITNFGRDLSFPIEKRADEIAIQYKIANLSDLLDLFRTDKDKLYTSLAKLFNRCADFTPGKQEEYLSGGKKEDKFCRFNLSNNAEKEIVSTENIFLMDNKNIMGTISATFINSDDGNLDIYFYDEIVDYFSLFNEEELKQFNIKLEQMNNEKDATLKSTIAKEIAVIAEPKRMALMAQLFAAARLYLRTVINDFDKKIDNGLINPFIRAAAGREESYKELGCKNNTTNFVIHGPPTSAFRVLDTYLKECATNHLKLLQPKVSASSLLSSSTVDNKKEDTIEETPKFSFSQG